MVMCGYLIREKNVEKLEKLGVRDSKMILPAKREKMFSRLKKIADAFHIVKISAKDIDKLRTISNLNRIEVVHMQALINKMKPDKVIIDAPEVRVKKFSDKVAAGIESDNNCEIIAENFADQKYREVGAASILAKVTRDREIKKLHKQYGFFGSGYTTDEQTIAFLKDWIKRNKDFPDCVRKSWITAQALRAEKEQRKINAFS